MIYMGPQISRALPLKEHDFEEAVCWFEESEMEFIFWLKDNNYISQHYVDYLIDYCRDFPDKSNPNYWEWNSDCICTLLDELGMSIEMIEQYR